MPQADRLVRICLVFAFAIGGFFFAPLFLVAGFLAWTLLKGTGAPRPLKSDPRGKVSARAVVPDDVTTATPRWEERFVAQCDSPAETAFLKAMIRVHRLTPDHGALHGDGLTLRLQAQAWYYRLDFLVDDWLIVEIDGATYHSSRDAVEHDQRRDAYLGDRGYTTLRIPADMVFRFPDEVVRRVQSTLRAGNPKRTPYKSLWQETRDAIAASGRALESVSKQVIVSTAVRDGTNACVEAFRTERTLIETAVRKAEHRLEVESFRAQSPEIARSFDATLAELSAFVAQSKQSDGSPTPSLGGMDDVGVREAVLKTLPFPAAASDADREIDAAIKDKHAAIMAERDAFFLGIRKRIAASPHLREQVHTALQELGCIEYGEYIGVARRDAAVDWLSTPAP